MLPLPAALLAAGCSGKSAASGTGGATGAGGAAVATCAPDPAPSAPAGAGGQATCQSNPADYPYMFFNPCAPLEDRITDLLGLTKRLRHRPSELSGGEQQRVALARALINKPAVVLADEPTGNLDSKNSDIVLSMLRRSNQELGQTVLMITHNPEAAKYGDRIIHMRDGQIVKPEDDPQWALH